MSHKNLHLCHHQFLNMEKKKLATWLFYYFFATTCIIGFSFIILGPSIFQIGDSNSIISIIIPTFLGQVAILFKWFVDQANNPVSPSHVINIPPLIVRLPPLAVILILLITLAMRIIGFKQDAGWTPSENQIQLIVTLCMSILNITTIYLISIFFQAPKTP